LPTKSIFSRSIFSIVANILRGGLSFTTILIVARTLGPADYGNYAFLLGSFTAIKVLLDMGSSSAFQTFISKEERGSIFVASYMGWQLVQFLLVVMIIALILPQKWFDVVWLDHGRNLVLLAFAAVFLQQQAWQTAIQIGESKRLTRRIQMLNVVIAFVHFLLVIGCWFFDLISVYFIFGLTLCEYLIFLVVAYKALSVSSFKREAFDGRAVLKEYLEYCAPLVLYSIFGFGYQFADRWMLQNFSGPLEQGFYEVGFRFGAVSLIITSSLLNIFWKEIAEAKENKTWELIQKLHRKLSRFLFTVGAIIAGFLIPWSEEILRLVLGSSYIDGALVVAIMLGYAAFNSVAQINNSTLLALGKTGAHLTLGSILMAVGILMAYLFLAPKDSFLPGLDMGSLGLAVKMILFIILHINVVSWWISREHGWKFDWSYQVVALGGALSFGWLSFELVETLNNFSPISLFFRGGLALLLYCGFAGTMVWRMPWIAGTSRQEIRNFFFKLVNLSWV
tara:strand:- start:16 stop:1536 length:1521 start_codon:yes stop_codon:yes gene_type:complete